MSSTPVLLLLCAAQASAPASLRPLDVRELPTAVLALAFAGRDEIVALSPDAVSLYRLRATALQLLARRPVEAEGLPVRRPAGLLRSEPGARSVWALASGWAEALLLDLDSGLEIRSTAEALPWPGARRGVRFRPGTSLLDAELPGLDPGPYLALAEGWALDAAGHLRRSAGAPASSPVGTPLVRLAGAELLTGSAAPPGEPDALLLFHASETAPRVLVENLPGSLSGLAATPFDDGRLRGILALETTAGTRLFSLELTVDR